MKDMKVNPKAAGQIFEHVYKHRFLSAGRL